MRVKIRVPLFGEAPTTESVEMEMVAYPPENGVELPALAKPSTAVYMSHAVAMPCNAAPAGGRFLYWGVDGGIYRLYLPDDGSPEFDELLAAAKAADRLGK